MNTELKKQLVPFDEAVQMKELGFDKTCFGFWFIDDEMLLIKEIGRAWDNIAHAPTYSQCFEWFEENHQMFVDRQTDTSVNEILDFTYRIKSWKFPPVTIEFDNPYDCFDRQKSQLACLRKLIQIAKDQK